MRYKIGTISGQSGLAVQTVREYADRGLLEMNKDGDSNYRYFDANAVNKAGAIRRLRMMGFTLAEVDEILTSASKERYEQLVDALLMRTQQQLYAMQESLALLTEHREQLCGYDEPLYRGRLVTSPGYYCLDYRKNGKLICDADPDRALLERWMDQSLFARNYSPLPVSALMGEQADHIIGLAVPKNYADRVPMEGPVYYRPPVECALFCIVHKDGPVLTDDGAKQVLAYLEENRLTIADEPYFVGEVPFFEDGQKVFYARLFIPIGTH